MSPLDFMTLDLDKLAESVSSSEKRGTPVTLDTERLSEIIETRKARRLAEAQSVLARDFDSMTILDIYATPILSETRRDITTRLLKLRASGHPITDDEIKSIIHPKYTDEEVVKRAELWEKMTSAS